MLAVVLVLGASSSPASGKLFLAGGGTTPPELVRRFIETCGPEGMIVVLPLASEAARGEGSVELLKEHGAKRVIQFAVASPTDQDRDGLARTLREARGIWMPGGIQSRIIERLGLAWARREIGRRVREGMNVYGTSAGAMAASRSMILGPGPKPETAETGPGLGLTSWVIDTHFGQRKREGRLRDALRITGRTRGLGIDERSWVLLQEDRILETHGGVLKIEL